MFSRYDYIMVEPSHPGNVGSAARAIKTMGFGNLLLVNPRVPGVVRSAEAVALASGALDVLEQAQIHDTLESALSASTFAFALTARGRDLGPPACDVREAAGLALRHVQEDEGARVAVVLGTERSGLTNEQIALCQRICHIPANPLYSSLNVSQALQLAAWEMRYALLSGAAPLAQAPDGRTLPGPAPAPGNSVQAFLKHWEEALIDVKFLDPDHPKKLMPRMRHLFARAQLSRDEVDMLRGVCTAMIATAKGRRQP